MSDQKCIEVLDHSSKGEVVQMTSFTMSAHNDVTAPGPCEPAPVQNYKSISHRLSVMYSTRQLTVKRHVLSIAVFTLIAHSNEFVLTTDHGMVNFLLKTDLI